MADEQWDFVGKSWNDITAPMPVTIADRTILVRDPFDMVTEITRITENPVGRERYDQWLALRRWKQVMDAVLSRMDPADVEFCHAVIDRKGGPSSFDFVRAVLAASDDHLKVD